MFTTVSTAKRENEPGPHNLQCYKDQKRKAKMLLKRYQKGKRCMGMVSQTHKTVTPHQGYIQNNTSEYF